MSAASDWREATRSQCSTGSAAARASVEYRVIEFFFLYLMTHRPPALWAFTPAGGRRAAPPRARIRRRADGHAPRPQARRPPGLRPHACGGHSSYTLCGTRDDVTTRVRLDCTSDNTSRSTLTYCSHHQHHHHFPHACRAFRLAVLARVLSPPSALVSRLAASRCRARASGPACSLARSLTRALAFTVCGGIIVLTKPS